MASERGGMMDDLISKSALIEAFDPEHYFDWYTPSIIETINEQPTVDAVPVVHGSWNIGSKPRCSVCGKSALREYDRDDWLSYVPSAFCPNCGADMRKKV